MSNKLYEENDIQNIANAIRNKNGTEDTYKVSQMSTAINSIEVIEQATAEGESLSLANTKAMPYSDYVVEGKSEQEGEPSPSNPSEIHSVADDVNLLNLDNCTFDNCTLNKDGSIKSNINNSYFCVIETTQLNSFLMQNLGKSFIFSIKDAIENKYISIVVYGSRTGGGTFQEATVYSTSRKVTISLANDFTNITKISFRVNRSSTSFTDTTTVINELKLQKGTVTSPYSPYNQGTVTIKQRGKNLTETDEINLTKDVSLTICDFNTGKFFNKISFTVICNNGTIDTPSSALFSYIDENNTTGYIAASRFEMSTGAVNGTYTFSVENVTIKSIKLLNWCVLKGLTKIQIEDGEPTPYEPYQTPHDYTFQTEPLRSLPNGVKDSKDTKQHTRVGRVVLDGSETGWFYASGQGFVLTTTNTPFSNRNIDVYKGFCNRFSFNENSTTWTGLYKCGFNSSNAFWIMDNGNIATSVEDFKTWLSNNPTEVLYQLAEEIIEPLTQNQAITMLDIIKTGSYEGTTNIYTDEDVKPTMKVGYYKKS